MTTLGQLLGQAEAAAELMSSSAGADVGRAFTDAATRSAAWPRLAAHSNRLLEAIGWHSSTLSRIAAATPVPVPPDPALARIADLMGGAADLLHSSPDMVHKATPTEWSRQHLLDNHPDIGTVAAAVYGPLARAAVWTLEPLRVATVSALWQSETLRSGPIPTSLDELLKEASDAAFSTHRTLTRLATLNAPANPLEYHLDTWQRVAHAALRQEPHRHTLRLISYTMAALCSAASNGLHYGVIDVPDQAVDRLRQAATIGLHTSRWPDHVRLEGRVDRELALTSHDLRNQLVPLFSPGGWATVDSGAATIRLVVDVAARIARHHHDVVRTVPIWINSRYVPMGTHTPMSRPWQREQPLTITLEDQRRGRWVQLSPTTAHPELDKLRSACRTLADFLDHAHSFVAARPTSVEAATRPTRPSGMRSADFVHNLGQARQFVAGLDPTEPISRGQAVRQAARRAAGWHELALVGDRLLTALGDPSPALRSICQGTPLPLPPEPILRQIAAAMASMADQAHGPDTGLHAETVDILARVARWTLVPHQRLNSDGRLLADALRGFLAEDEAHRSPSQSADVDPVQEAIRAWRALGAAALDNRPATPTMRRLAADLTTVITVAADAAIVIEEEGGLPTDTVQNMLGHLSAARRASHDAADWPAHLRTGEGHEDPAFVGASENLRNRLQPASGHNPWTAGHPNLVTHTRLLMGAGSDLAGRFAQVVSSQPIKASGEHLRTRTQATQSRGSGRRGSTPEMDAQLIATARKHPQYTTRELARMLGYNSPGQVNARLNDARAKGLLPGSTRAKHTAIGPGRAEYDRLVGGSREMAASLARVHGILARITAPAENDGKQRLTAAGRYQTDRSMDLLTAESPPWEVIQPPTRPIDGAPTWGPIGSRTVAP